MEDSSTRSKIDEIKEQIGLNKFIMGLVAVMIFSITGYVVSHYMRINSAFMVILSVTMVILIYIFIVIFSKTIKKIKLLKDL